MKVSDLPIEERNLRRTRTDFVVIYALVDPRDEQIRYVGKTEKRLAQRLSEHIRFPVNSRTRAWISDLRAASLTPKIEPITCCGQQWWQGKETYWIRWLRIRGVRLLNSDPGGVCRKRDGSLNLTGKVKNFIAKKAGRGEAVWDFRGHDKKRHRKQRRRREMKEKARLRGVKVYSREEIREMNRARREHAAYAAECAHGVDPVIRRTCASVRSAPKMTVQGAATHDPESAKPRVSQSGESSQLGDLTEFASCWADS